MKLALATLLLIVAGCGQAGGQPTAPPSVTMSPPASSSPRAASAGVETGVGVVVKDFSLDPKDVTATGPMVSLAVENAGPTIHNVTIRDESGAVVMATRDLRPGESETISGTVAAGTYVMFCSLPGHESLGIKGKLIVAP
jgi:plastocyanin